MSGYATRIADYTDRVLSGDIVAGEYTKLACRRYLDDLAAADEKGFYLDPEAGQRGCSFFDKILVHTSGEYDGLPFILADWQAFCCWNLFAWRRKDNGFRRFREAYLSVARGNGKTPFLAGLLLQLFAFDSPAEPAAEVIVAATKYHQAWRYTFCDARRFVERSDLKDFVTVQKGELMVPVTGSTMIPIGSDSKGLDSMRLHAVGIDELHAMRAIHEEMLEKVKTALGKRRQPLVITTTTAGNEESFIWQREDDYARQVIKGVVPSEQFFAFIASIDEEDDWQDEACWPKANPMLLEPNSPVKLDHIRTMAARAAVSPSERNKLIRYHLNRLVTSEHKAFDDQTWMACEGELDWPTLANTECYVGFDWGQRDDLAAVAYVWPLTVGDDRRYAIDCDIFVPESGPRTLVDEPWRTWIERGFLTVTPSEFTDSEAVYRKLAQRGEELFLTRFVYDKWNSHDFARRVDLDLGVPLEVMTQSHRNFNEPTKEFELAVREGRIVHNGNPVLRWCASNLVIHCNAYDHIMPYKARCADKIDPIVAVIMGLSQAMLSEGGRSFYDTPGHVVEAVD